jgi:hypothetical protein
MSTVTSLVALYGCETWSVKEREHMLRVFENGVLRRIFGLKRKWQEELHNLYASPNITRMIKSRGMRWTGHLVCIGDM